MGLSGTPWDGGKPTSDQEVAGSSPSGGARSQIRNAAPVTCKAAGQSAGRVEPPAREAHGRSLSSVEAPDAVFGLSCLPALPTGREARAGGPSPGGAEAGPRRAPSPRV